LRGRASENIGVVRAAETQRRQQLAWIKVGRGEYFMLDTILKIVRGEGKVKKHIE